MKTEEEAYRYWLRTTRACVAAEQSFGSDVVRRIRYRDLVEAPQEALRSCLEFVNETYSADCLMPLKEKINSSNVPAGFDPRDERTDPALRDEAHELFEALDAAEPAHVGSAEASMQLEKQFLEQARFIAWAEYEMARRLEVERNSPRRRLRLFRGRGAG